MYIYTHTYIYIYIDILVSVIFLFLSSSPTTCNLLIVHTWILRSIKRLFPELFVQELFFEARSAILVKTTPYSGSCSF